MRWIVVVAALAACQQKDPGSGSGSGSGSKESAPTGADCQLVGDLLASYELGNYAEPEERAPVVGKYKTACESTRVTDAEVTCIGDSVDKFTASRCAPRLLPEFPVPDPTCAQGATQLAHSLPQGDDNAYERRSIRRQIAKIWLACERDHWPDDVKTCIATSADVARTWYAYRACAEKLTPDLLGKLDAELAVTTP